MVNEYECPMCGDDVAVKDADERVTCRKCGTALLVERDADYDDGWKDLTKLVVDGEREAERARTGRTVQA